MRPPSSATRAGSASETVRLRKMPALDGLRGVAVLGVLLFHAGHLVGGYLGVDLFFVLSGFLITSLLLSERIRTGRVGLGAFWSRRARRLLPALLAVLAAVAVYAAVWAAPTELRGIRADALATLGYIANWHTIAAGHSYWDLFRAPSPLEHTWSLAIEEQFYLVWPLVVLAMVAIGRRNPARAVLLGASGLAVLSLVRMLVLYTPGGDPQRVYLGTDTRAAALLLGAALGALVIERGHPRRRTTRAALEVVGLTGAAGLAWAWVTVDGQSDGLYQGGLFLCGLAAVAVLAAASAPEAGVLGRGLSFAPLRALGIVSYGLYLWHWPVYLVLTRDRVGMGGWPLVMVRIAVSLAFAVVSWLALERPIRYGALPGWRVAAAAPAAAALVVVAVVLTTAAGHQPTLAAASASSTGAKGARAVVPAAPSSTAATPDTGAGAGAPAGEAPAPNHPARVLLVGDSVASSLVDGFSSLESPLGFQLSHDTWPSCTLAEGATAARNPLDDHPADISALCDTRWAEDVGVAQPDLVIVVLSGEAFLDYEVDGAWETPCSSMFSRWVRGNLAEDLGVLTSTGARAVIVLPAHLDLPWVPADFNTRIDCFASALRDVARATVGASTVDLNRLTCPHDRCVHELDGVTLRPDGYHYDGPASAVAAEWIASQIPALARS